MKNNLSFKLVVISLFLYCGNNSLEAASGKKYALASPDGKLKEKSVPETNYLIR